ncbi:MAG: M55 family metallopeptidase [Hyphomicrobiales bacterium]|nr:M55 family metallopeptidase [Hyphomicrobiales bacterium]
MKIFISADIEGVAGVISPQQGQPGNGEYERARRLMTEEVNAAINGALGGGATRVLVNDSHGPMVNLIPELLDARAELILGRPKPMNMFCGLEADFAGVFCTGYHSGAGQHGVLSHTVNGFAFAAIRVNGIDCAEATLYGAYAGSLGVPVLLLTGDDRMKAQCGPHFAGARLAVVKQALGHRAARALSPQAARALIRAEAEMAVREREKCKPFLIAPPCRLEIDLTSVALADLAMVIPPAKRIGPKSVAFPSGDIAAAIGWVNTISAMSAALR